MPLPVPELLAVAVPVRVAPAVAVAVELLVRERIAGPLGALGTAVPVLLGRGPVLLRPAATVAGLLAVATWSAVAFAELPFAEQVVGTVAVPSEQVAAEVRTVPVLELWQLDPGTRRR